MPTPILYLSYLGGMGGGESSLLTHIQALDRSQFAPYVICGTPGAFADALRASNIQTEIIPFRQPYFKAGLLPVVTPAFSLKLAQFLRAHAIQLIHCNDVDSAYYAALPARLLGVPLVWTCWAWWLAERGWKTTFYGATAAHIISPTQYIRDCLVQANSQLASRITVIPFGVNTTEFAPAPERAADGMGRETAPALGSVPTHSPDTGSPVITLVARFQSVKGHATLLDAAPAIVDAVPNTRFWLVGDTAFDTQDSNETRRMVRERVQADPRLRAAVEFCGFRNDVANVLRSSDIVVCPSWFETYGMAIIEAMACGVPVVCTNMGGPSETMVEGETGFLVPPKTPDALAARVVELLREPELRRRMGASGRRRVLERYDLRDSAARVQGVYRSVLSR